MNLPGKDLVTRRVLLYEKVAFALIILLIWLDEIIDIPYLLLGAQSTPLNWRESLFESICIIILGSVIVRITGKTFERMKHLEGMLLLLL